MKTFEIHITVDLDDANMFKNICYLADIKCIEIESLNIYGQNIDIQHMTSIIKQFINKEEAIEFAKSLSNKLGKCDISVTMAASVYYSHKELHGKHSNEKQELLFQKGINWNDYPSFFKRGTFIKKILTQKKFSTEELAKLPIKHEARLNPELLVNRSEYKIMDWPRISSMENAVDLLFKKDLNVVT